MITGQQHKTLAAKAPLPLSMPDMILMSKTVDISAGKHLGLYNV